MAYNVKSLPGNRYVNLFIGAVVEQLFVFAVIIANNTIGRRRTFVSTVMYYD